MRIPTLSVASLCLVASVWASAACATTPSTDEQAALSSFQSLLEALGQRDRAGMLQHSLPGGQASLMRKGKPVQMSLADLAEKVSAPGTDTHRETIVNPLVQVDQDLAFVWARFEFRVNDRLDHCGRDLATLVKIDGRWLVASIADTGSEACGR